MKYFAKVYTSSKRWNKDLKQGSLPSKLILLTLHWTSFMLPATQEIDCDNNAKRKAPWAEVIKERVTFLQSLEITYQNSDSAR